MGEGLGVGVAVGVGVGRRPLHFKRTDVDATIHHAIKARAALVVERRRSKARVACVNSRAAGQQRMREGWAAVVLQRTEHRIGVNLIAGAG